MNPNVYIFYIPERQFKCIKVQRRKDLYIAWFHHMFQKCWSVVLLLSKVCLMLFLLTNCCVCVYCCVHSENQGTLCTSKSHYNKFVWHIANKGSMGTFLDLFLWVESLNISPLTSSTLSIRIPTILCTSEQCQMDVLIYLRGILTDLVVADLNTDRPPSLLKNPADLGMSC